MRPRSMSARAMFTSVVGWGRPTSCHRPPVGRWAEGPWFVEFSSTEVWYQTYTVDHVLTTLVLHRNKQLALRLLSCSNHCAGRLACPQTI